MDEVVPVQSETQVNSNMQGKKSDMLYDTPTVQSDGRVPVKGINSSKIIKRAPRDISRKQAPKNVCAVEDKKRNREDTDMDMHESKKNKVGEGRLADDKIEAGLPDQLREAK